MCLVKPIRVNYPKKEMSSVTKTKVVRSEYKRQAGWGTTQTQTPTMYGAVLSGLALLGTALALPLEQQQEFAVELAELSDGTIGYLPVNSGWASFPFGHVNSSTHIAMNLFCSGYLNITDIFCSGDQFAIYDNGVYVTKTSDPVFNDCKSNTTDPNYAQRHHEWSSDSIKLHPGFHNITLRVLKAPYGYGTGAIRVDTRRWDHHGDHHDGKKDLKHHDDKKDHKDHHYCNVKACPVEKAGLVFVDTKVPRCQAEHVCKSMGLHLAHIDITNFMDSTDVAYQCNGANKQAWIDDWNGDKYSGNCLVLSTGNQAPGGAINVPSCCSVRLPVICQKKPSHHPSVQYSCNDCQDSCYCRREHHLRQYKERHEHRKESRDHRKESRKESRDHRKESRKDHRDHKLSRDHSDRSDSRDHSDRSDSRDHSDRSDSRDHSDRSDSRDHRDGRDHRCERCNNGNCVGRDACSLRP